MQRLPARARVRTARLLQLGLALSVGACAQPQPSKTRVRVFAAASLSESFRALERAFEAEHGEIELELNFAGSQLLAAQLLEGAGAELFAAASPAQLERVAAERPLDARRAFASNELVLVVPAGSRLRVPAQLGEPGLRIVLAGEAVPAGRYAREALDALGLRARVEANVVSNETSVRAVIAKLALGEADAGIAYATDLAGAPELEAHPLLRPGEGPQIRYELALLEADPARSRAAREVAAFVSSEAGQSILRAHGFAAPPRAQP